MPWHSNVYILSSAQPANQKAALERGFPEFLEIQGNITYSFTCAAVCEQCYLSSVTCTTIFLEDLGFSGTNPRSVQQAKITKKHRCSSMRIEDIEASNKITFSEKCV